jgi:hypothetical protein
MLQISFTVHFENEGVDEIIRPRGPLFHRWLPNGRQDAITIPVKDSRDHLELWFERRGYVDNRFIQYDRKRSEVDLNVMRQQAKLEAGQLWGEATFVHVTNEELKAVTDNRVDSDEYIAAGKRILDFLYEPLSIFIDVLRTQYGQYWLPELKQWDSRIESLGNYCSTTLWMRWREGRGNSWKRFQPTNLRSSYHVEPLPGRGYAEYLTQQDWQRLRETFDPEKKPSLAVILLGRAHELSDTGHARESFIQGVTALELAIQEALSRHKHRVERADASIDQFTNLPLRTQVLILASALGLPTSIDLNDVLHAIDVRHDIVHKGRYPKDQDARFLLPLLRCAAVFIGLDEHKTPVLVSANQLSPPEAGGQQALTFKELSMRNKGEKANHDE